MILRLNDNWCLLTLVIVVHRCLKAATHYLYGWIVVLVDLMWTQVCDMRAFASGGVNRSIMVRECVLFTSRLRTIREYGRCVLGGCPLVGCICVTAVAVK